jgi:hypothetical protein
MATATKNSNKIKVQANGSTLHVGGYARKLYIRDDARQYNLAYDEPPALRINVTGADDKSYGVHVNLTCSAGGLLIINGKSQNIVVNNTVYCIAQRPVSRIIRNNFNSKILVDNNITKNYIEGIYGLKSGYPTDNIPTLEISKAGSSVLDINIDALVEVIINGDVAELQTNAVTLCNDSIESIKYIGDRLLIREVQRTANKTTAKKANNFDAMFRI